MWLTTACEVEKEAKLQLPNVIIPLALIDDVLAIIYKHSAIEIIRCALELGIYRPPKNKI